MFNRRNFFKAMTFGGLIVPSILSAKLTPKPEMKTRQGGAGDITFTPGKGGSVVISNNTGKTFAFNSDTGLFEEVIS